MRSGCGKGLMRLAVVWAGTAAALFPSLAGAQVAARSAATTAPPGRWQDASLEEYRKHLEALRGLTQACARARDVQTCDPTRVGPDDRVPIADPAEDNRRMVRYGWLRVLLYKADGPDEPDPAKKANRTENGDRDGQEEGGQGAGGQKAGGSGRKESRPDESQHGVQAESVRAAPRSTSQLLQDAEVRLAQDMAEAGGPVRDVSEHPAIRDTMKQVLAEREFRNLRQATESDTVLERVGNWLNHVFAGAEKLRARSAWVGKALVWAFFLAIASLAAWRLLRIERRWRSRLVSPKIALSREAPAVRDWEAWLSDARRAAAEGAWREAIHFLYWASIARLESKRVWPADKARTPREYLALLAPGDPRKRGLASLTGSFERTWYGRREAGEGDYRQAEQAAAALLDARGVAEGGLPGGPLS